MFLSLLLFLHIASSNNPLLDMHNKCTAYNTSNGVPDLVGCSENENCTFDSIVIEVFADDGLWDDAMIANVQGDTITVGITGCTFNESLSLDVLQTRFEQQKVVLSKQRMKTINLEINTNALDSSMITQKFQQMQRQYVAIQKDYALVKQQHEKEVKHVQSQCTLATAALREEHTQETTALQNQLEDTEHQLQSSVEKRQHQQRQYQVNREIEQHQLDKTQQTVAQLITYAYEQLKTSHAQQLKDEENQFHAYEQQQQHQLTKLQQTVAQLTQQLQVKHVQATQKEMEYATEQARVKQLTHAYEQLKVSHAQQLKDEENHFHAYEQQQQHQLSQLYEQTVAQLTQQLQICEEGVILDKDQSDGCYTGLDDNTTTACSEASFLKGKSGVRGLSLIVLLNGCIHSIYLYLIAFLLWLCISFFSPLS